MSRSPKDWEISICAITKSVIESGAPMSEWDEKVRHGMKILMTLTNQAIASDISQQRHPKESQ